MKKSWLILGGVGVIGLALYRYFKYQVDLALQYDYNIKNFNILIDMGTRAIFKIWLNGKFVLGSWNKWDGGVNDTGIFPHFLTSLNKLSLSYCSHILTGWIP